MFDEIKKYRAQFFQIAGLSCMSPLGKIFLDLKELHKQDLNLAFLVHLLFSFALFSVGIILIRTGLKVLKWER